ncbi:MAG: nucleoside phosphorylase [Prevotella sp.]|nr:nucleoside phosphorylase [Prevotella sp.]MBR1839125.1 nucleoside phosphorylase [Prevotella sp.]
MIPPSELPINADGSVFHLHLRPEHLAERVILVGDPGRVNTVASFFDSVECDIQSREFHTITGSYKGKRISCVSTGIGCDNIDIVMTELDALVNIDLEQRQFKEEHTTLTLVRVGTCGGIQPFTPLGSFIASVKSIGFDGLLNYYEGRDEVCDLALEEAFCKHMKWSTKKGAPYVAVADKELIDRVAADDMVRGITVSCGGFYGPQGRFVRLIPQDYEQNLKVESFSYIDPLNPDAAPLEICNFEMESSAVAGMSALLGHKAMTCCMVVANRYTMEMDTEYKNTIENLITLVLDRI